MKQVLLLTSILGLCFNAVFSQCSFTATVSPSNPILCPNDTIMLSTELYDSYQWYKDAVLIPGATNQTLQVTAANDGGSQFYVEATLLGCSENSDTILLDGWVFLLPYVITNTPPVQIGGSGEAYYCDGTIVELEFGLPYTENIVWYESGNPIPGEDSTILQITQSGNYTVSGAPTICPNFIQYLGVTIPIIINPPFEPDWLDWPMLNWGANNTCSNCVQCYFYQLGDSVVADSGITYDWWTSGTLDNVWMWSPYLAECYDAMGCVGLDTVEFFVASIEEHPFLSLNIYPNPATDFIQLYLQDDMENYQVRFIDMYGRILKQQKLNSSIDVSTLAAGIYTVEVFSKKYFLRKRFIKQ